MLAIEVGVFEEWETVAIREALLQCVEAQTQGQVRNLDLDCQGNLVVVTGGCESITVKQRVTRAIRSAEPDVRLQNEIRVRA